MNILLLAYNFPPSKRVSGFRPYSFVKYLPEFGINITLLTNLNEEEKETLLTNIYIDNIFTVENSVLHKFLYKLKILHAWKKGKFNRLLLLQNNCFSWVNRSYKVGKKILKEEQIDAIMAIGEDFKTFILGYRLSKKFGVPLILDYQDAWSEKPFDIYRLKWFEKVVKRRVKKHEKKIIDKANILIAVGPEYAKHIAKNLNINAEEFKIVYNGFFENYQQKNIVDKSKKPFSISYFGSIYGNRKNIAVNFLQGLKKMIAINGLDLEDIEFRYAGITSRRIIEQMVKNIEIVEHYKDCGYFDQDKFMENDEYMKAIQNSTILVTFAPKGAEFVIPTKIYDYAVGNSHILVIGEDGAISSLCNNMEQEYTLVSNDVHKISETLDRLYKKWKNNSLKFGCNINKLSKYNRRYQAKILAEHLKNDLK